LTRQRLHMSAGRAGPSDYCDFGTGVFDMEDADRWENIYSATDESCHHNAVVHDPSMEDIEREPRLSSTLRSCDEQNAVDDLPGFVHSQAHGMAVALIGHTGIHHPFHQAIEVFTCTPARFWRRQRMEAGSTRDSANFWKSMV